MRSSGQDARSGSPMVSEHSAVRGSPSMPLRRHVATILATKLARHNHWVTQNTNRPAGRPRWPLWRNRGQTGQAHRLAPSSVNAERQRRPTTVSGTAALRVASVREKSTCGNSGLRLTPWGRCLHKNWQQNGSSEPGSGLKRVTLPPDAALFDGPRWAYLGSCSASRPTRSLPALPHVVAVLLCQPHVSASGRPSKPSAWATVLARSGTPGPSRGGDPPAACNAKNGWRIKLVLKIYFGPRSWS